MRSLVLHQDNYSIIAMLASTPRRQHAEHFRDKVSAFLPDTPFLQPSTLPTLQDPILIDVRNPEEALHGTLPNAVTPRQANPFLDSSRPIVCFCTVGLRSGAYARTVQAPGRIIYNYSILEHVWDGGNLVRTDGKQWNHTVHAYSSRYAKLFPEQFDVSVFSAAASLTKILPALPMLTGALGAWAGRQLRGSDRDCHEQAVSK